MTLARLWLAGTGVALTAVAVWTFAPILVFVALLAAALGLVCAAIIAIARALQRRRERGPG